MRKQDITVGAIYTFSERGRDSYNGRWFDGMVVRVTGPAETQKRHTRGTYATKHDAVVFPVEVIDPATGNPYVEAAHRRITHAESRQLIRLHSETVSLMAARAETERAAAERAATAQQTAAAFIAAEGATFEAAGVSGYALQALAEGQSVQLTATTLARLLEAARTNATQEA